MKLTNLLTVLLMLGATGCVSMAPKATSSDELGVDKNLEFRANTEETAAAVRSVLSEKKWKLQYEGNEPPKKNYGAYSNQHPFSGKDYNKLAWERARGAAPDPKVYIQARTPMSAFSFGAELFIVVFGSTDGGSVVSIAASTSQIVEKKKLDTYISEFSASLNEKTR